MAHTDIQVIHNQDQQRFEATIDGHLAIAAYRIASGRILFTHTEVPPQYRGRGIAGQIVKVGLEYAHEHDLEVVPLCSYVAAYIRRHPEYQSLVHSL